VAVDVAVDVVVDVVVAAARDSRAMCRSQKLSACYCDMQPKRKG
jgi:hypothetical protein